MKMEALRPFETSVFTYRHGLISRKTWLINNTYVSPLNLALDDYHKLRYKYLEPRSYPRCLTSSKIPCQHR
jgi:hypothetical protein